MKYHALHLDHVRWRSDTMHGEINEQPSMGTFLQFQGRDTARLGWHFNSKKSGEGLTIELERSEAEALYRLLGERLAVEVGNTPT